jgi:hypothetical protein
MFRPGTDVMILKIFVPKNLAKKSAFLAQNNAKLCKILIITLVFEKNAIFFRRKLKKIDENSRNFNHNNIEPGCSVGNFFSISRVTPVFAMRGRKFCPNDFVRTMSTYVLK